MIDKFLDKASKGTHISSILHRYGKAGQSMLAANTPVDSGLTAASWDYEIESAAGKHTITWTNSNIVNGVNIAVILQSGHGTGTGGYVRGIDYINPALRPLFEKFASDIWKEVTDG